MSYCHCSHRGAPPKDRCIDSLCVNCGLCVKGRAKVGSLTIGCTGNWSIFENANGNLEFAYRGQPRLVINKNGGIEPQTVTTNELVVTDQIIYLGGVNALNTWRLRPHPDRGTLEIPDNALLWEIRTSVTPEVWTVVGDPLAWFPPPVPSDFFLPPFPMP